VPASLASNLPVDTCAASNLCVPTQKLMNQNFTFPSCTVAFTGTAGACVPDCLVSAQGTTTQFLSSAGCKTRELCAPCVDPSTGSSTGACN
jgi:hypothetical protein